MRFGQTAKQIVCRVGCALFCLAVCVLAFWNRTLVWEPISIFLRGEENFEKTRNVIQQNYLSDRFREKNDLITLNGGYARLTGRTRYNGVQKMKNGMLAAIESDLYDISAFVDNLARVYQELADRGIPFLFVMTPYKVPVNEEILPKSMTDETNAVADHAIAELVAQGVPALDLRREMSWTGEQVERYFYRTDHHWNADGAFTAYQRIMEAIQERFQDTKTSYTDPALWEKMVVPHWWLGSQGRRVGPLFAGTDDLDYYLPIFETEMSRYAPGVCAYRGDFRQACMSEKLIEWSDFFHADTYSRYLGGGYPLTYHRNPGAENQLKLMIIRDSFMLPVECFLSTEFTALDVIDPRGYSGMNEMDYVSLNHPDMVILMLCPGTLASGENKYYSDFGSFRDPVIVGEKRVESIVVSSGNAKENEGILQGRLEGGKSYILTLEGIQVQAGEMPPGACVKVFDGDREVDQTIFDIEYGNQYEFRWGFQLPEDEEEHDYHLHFYSGLGTEADTKLVYQGILLQECLMK